MTVITTILILGILGAYLVLARALRGLNRTLDQVEHREGRRGVPNL